MKKYTCFRCTYSWIPRVSKPTVCPKCKSPYWRKPRVTIEEQEENSNLIKPDHIEEELSQHELNELPDLKDVIERE